MKSLLYGLAAFSLWQTGLAVKDSNGNYILKPVTDPSLLSVRDPERTITILEPILPSEMGLHRRAGHFPVGLQNDTSIFWGQGGNGSNVMVNLTLATGETQMILSMDHFKEELASVICDDDLTLTFKDETTYQDAIDDWEWVNFEEKRTFIMIVNYGGCSSESGRQPWVVTAATYDNANFRVEFTANQTEWYDLNNPYEIEWGTYTPLSQSALAARWNPFDALNDLTSPNSSPEFDVNLAHSIPETLWEKTTASGLDLTIGCDACGTTGKITIAGKLKGSLLRLSIDEAYVQAIPSNIRADFNPSFTVAGELVGGWKKSWDILKVPLSEFSIPLVFSVGPELRLSAGFELSGVQGSATVKTGISARIPDSATAKVDFHGSGTHVDGWKPDITTKPITFEAEVQGTLAIYTAIGVDIGMTVFKKIDFGVGLELQVPKVTMTLGAEFNSAGEVCPNRPEMFGVKFDASIGVDLKIQGWNGDKDRPFFEEDLWNAPDLYKFPHVCIPFEFGTKSPISLTKLVSVPTSTKVASTTSETPALTKEPVTTGEPSKATSTKEPATIEPSKPTTSTKLTSEEPSKPTTLIHSTTEVTTIEPTRNQTAITVVEPTTTGGSSTGTANPTSIERTTTGHPPIGTGPIVPSGTGPAVNTYPPTSGKPGGPILSNSTGIWISKQSSPTTTPIIGYFPQPPTTVTAPITDYFPESTAGPYNPGKPDGNQQGPGEGDPNTGPTTTTITTSPTYPTLVPGPGKPPGNYNSTITTSTFTSSYNISTSAIHYTTPPVPTTSLPVYGYGYGNGGPEDHTKGYRPRGRLARHLV
ncbi:hypothetical protein VE01_04459 [Pseudogymnoascus verrucosus]|uniref:Uncharacterized protein n=1 Tax=Pseudogymnoascus verrucosus TaxID=342668 RepID=A0A1B8GP33_9PEZI|nr:uncharacterized protein VE01_04459 [Pseudogymnoascus verrucosus]OBT97561.1 hypothetical protein VE01_04459 [Pseudogymnoascus verrucosus]